MKTRKLFAILTLVAFMMTLLPVAAFAADASKGASKISLGNTSKSVGSDVEVTVALRDTNNRSAALANNDVLYIWAERADDSISDVDNFIGETVPGNVYYENDSMVGITNVSGSVEVEYTSNIAGEVVFKAAIAPKTVSPTPNALDEYVIGTRSFEWKQRGADRILLVGDYNFAEDMKWIAEAEVEYEDKEGNNKKANITVTIEGDRPTDNLAISELEDEFEKAFNGKWNDYDVLGNTLIIYGSGDVYKLEGLEANGDEVELTFEVIDKLGNPLAGEKVEFSINKSGALVDKDEDTTDVLGQVDVEVNAYEADDYKLTVKRGSTIAVVELDFEADLEAFEIAEPDPIKDKVAIGYAPSLEFKLYDVFGNRITDEPEDFEDIDVEFSKKPSSSDLEDDDLELVFEDNVLKVEFDQEPDVAGIYEVKVKLDNGKFATISFEAAEQDEITSMVLDIKESYLAYGSTSSAAKVKYYDDNKVYYEDDTLGAVEFSVSNSALAKMDGNKVVAREARHNDFSSGKVVITAIDTARGLVATDEITIGSMIAGLEVTVPEEDTLLTETANITYQLVNQNGDPIAFDAGKKDDIDVDAYVVSAPEGANVDINLPLEADYQKSLSRTGTIDVEVESEVAGNVVIALIVNGVVDYDGDEDEITLSSTTEVKFVAERVAIGAKNVTLFIGSTNYVVDGQPMVSDLAPFIQDNRTFVPVRVVAEALGAEVEFDAATQTVTIAREDLTATLTIGSNEITLSDGTVVVSDVAPFIDVESGRTVLPFRVIGEEVFGAEVEAVSAADGSTIAVQFEQ